MRICESADVSFSLKIAQQQVAKLQTLSYCSLKLRTSECDTLQSAKRIRTYHRTDYCSYIFAVR
jgi:hypothetical protein